MKNEHNLITILNYQQFPVFVKSPLLLLVSRRVQLEGFALISVLSNNACKFVPYFQHYFPRHILVFAHKNLRVASQRRRGIAKKDPS